MKKFDIIIAGGGCAGLSLLVRIIKSGRFDDKKILLVDREAKSTNDRTWCFWESQPGLFEEVVYRSWDQLHFHGKDFSRLLDIAPYRYNMVRGIDFYAHCHSIIKTQPNVERIQGNITSLKSVGNEVLMKVNDEEYSSPLAFNSIPKENIDDNKYYYLKQHFKGWSIKTSGEVFDPTQATLMDFRTDQKNGTTFIYVLPFSTSEALVEYTLFSTELLSPDAYNDALRKHVADYITKLPYTITSEEFGVIPMTNYPFKLKEGRIINIGTAGGHTKASTGYTFQFIQKNTQQIVDSMIATGSPSVPPPAKKFSFYDSTLLRILQTRKMEGIDLFTDLFRHGDPQTVLKFLDNETNLGEDINIMKRLPTGIFGKAALRNIFKI